MQPVRRRDSQCRATDFKPGIKPLEGRFQDRRSLRRFCSLPRSGCDASPDIVGCAHNLSSGRRAHRLPHLLDRNAKGSAGSGSLEREFDSADLTKVRMNAVTRLRQIDISGDPGGDILTGF